MRRIVEVDPTIRDRASVVAALAHGREVAAAAVSAALGLAPPLGGEEDPRWYMNPEVEQALDGWADPDARPMRVEVVLWPAHTALLTAGDLPPGVAVYAEPDPAGELSRGALFAPATGHPRRSGTAARDGRRTERARGGERRGAAAAPRRTPVEVVVDLSETRHLWHGDLQIDTAYQVLLAAAERRARTHRDVTVVDDTVGGPEPRLVFVLRVSLPDVTPATPVDALLARGASVVAAVWAPLRQLEREVDAAVRTTHARLRPV
jgi:hypothetical protein